jgi:hypothetical protein
MSRLSRGGLPRWLTLGVLSLSVASAAVPFVRDGGAVAVIVTSDSPSPTVAYAAQEIASHIERATGAKLTIITEREAAPATPSAPRIYLGDTRAARTAGIEATKLAPESFTLRTVGEHTLLIAGRDSPTGDPLDRDTSAGTLFGVYEWLERDAGVRWLWPGDLGTHVPAARTLIARDADATVAPAFAFRHVRAGTSYKFDHAALGFTEKAAADYAAAQAVFLRRHRMGRSQRLSYGHAFSDWWAKHGAAHPEWFQLVNGKRGPPKAGARYAMCVSEPGLHREIVTQWRARGAPDFINVVENDILGQCECDHCRAWDGPAPADANRFYAPNFKVHGAPFVSDRYARFAAAVQALAAEHNPRVTAVGYAYFNYFQAPTSGVKLHEHVLLGYCPSAGWYPRGDEEHAWYQRQWSGWRETGARLFMRTNYFLDGYCMPFVFARQFADDFQHAARAGMAGTDFDSLTGQWSTQGPSLYLLMRLHTRPAAGVDALLDEYCAAFGAAAPHVRAYFDHWERYTMDNRPLIARAFADRVAIRWRTWAKAAHVVFPAECFSPGEAILARAAEAAAGDAEALARVRFLQTGLTHARLSANVSRLLTLADPSATPERGQRELAELLAFRRAHEREWFSNLNHCAWVEDLSWKLSHVTKQEPEHYP